MTPKNESYHQEYRKIRERDFRSGSEEFQHMMESKQGWAGRLTGRSGGKIEWGCHRREGGPSRKRGNFIGSDDVEINMAKQESPSFLFFFF